MKRFILFTISIILFGCSAPEKKLDNTFYPFNNAMRTLQNIPEGVDSQSKLIKKLGYKGFGGHHSEDYFVRRAALDKAGLEMPEIYVPATINEDGSVTYLNELHEIIEDSKNRDLLVSLAVFGESFKENKEEGDKHLVKSIQKLADFAAPFKVKIAVYPHVNFYCERLDHSIKIAKEVNRPNVGAIFNTCHLFKVEGMNGWEQKLKEAVPYLYMISINGLDSGYTQEFDWDQLIQPLGEGSFDTYQIVKVAKDAGYNGLFGLQCYNIKQDCSMVLSKSLNTWKGYQNRYSKQTNWP